MSKNTHTRLTHSYALIALLPMLLACALGCWAGVATYQLDGGTTVPAHVGYWLSGDATTVKIEIIDAATSDVIYTFPTISGSNATRGFHSNVVTWNGEAGVGGSAPPGDFKVRATVVSDMSGTNLKPLWESCTANGSGSNGWGIYGIAINRNPGSPFYGRVYVGNYDNRLGAGNAKAVWEFNPDGSVIGQLPQPAGPGFGPSGPWGICVDADDHVYVSNRSFSNIGGAGPVVWRYRWDSGSNQWVCGPAILGTTKDRYLGCNYASGAALRLVDTCSEGVGLPAMSRIYFGSGDPPASFTNQGVDTTTSDWFFQPAISADGTVYVAGLNLTNDLPTKSIGALTQWDLSANPVPTAGANRNANLTQASGLALTADDATIWMARHARNPLYNDDGNIDPGDFYRLPRAQAMTITTSSPELKRYGWGTLYAATQYPRFIAVEGESNLAVAGTDGHAAIAGSLFGMYSEPTGPNTSETRIGRNTITWGNDYSPEVVSASIAPDVVPCGGSALVSVTAVDQNSIPSGASDIASCVFFCPALGYGTAGSPATGTAMTPLTGPDEQKRNTYALSVSIPANAPTGQIVADIYLNDVHGSVTPGHGTVTITVTGGTITGTITEGITGLPAAGVTMRATKGGFYRQGVTDANGVYSIDVTPGTGYMVSPAVNAYKNTIPTEYNLQSDWPADPGASDWPKTAGVSLGGSSTVGGRVWPLAITQATYDWAAHSYRLGGRTVCVTGTVLRQAADATVAPVQKGYDGYYFLTDTLGSPSHSTQQAMKVKPYAKGSECAKGDKVVLVGTLDPPPSYGQGVLTPVFAPTVTSSANPIPDARDAGGLTNVTLYSNLIGGWYAMRGKVVSRVGTQDEFYVLTGGDSPGIEFRIDMDSIASTGIGYPTVGQVLDIQGVLDEMAPWNGLRALRPGEPGDVVPSGLAPDVAAAKSRADNSPVSLPNAQLTVVAGGGVPSDVAYIEQPDRACALRVHTSGLPPGVGSGDMVMVQGTMATNAYGERFIEALYIARNSSARPIDALGMNNRDAASAKALGLFVKIWGKVTAQDTFSFTITDGAGTAIRVLCGLLAKPDIGRSVRVRGVVSRDESGPVLLMRDERVDWTYAEEAYQPLPFAGAYKYARDFLVLGPFADEESIPSPEDPISAQTYRLDHDFIADATGSAYSESSMASLRPRLGGAVGTKTWRRSQPTGDNADFTSIFSGGLTNCTFYAHLWVYSPTYLYGAMRVGSADSVKVIVNGVEVYRFQASNSAEVPPTVGRDEIQGSDELYWAPLNAGLNSVLLKVEQGTGLSGVNCQFVDVYNVGAPGWGNAIPLSGMGYLLDAQP